MRYPSRRVAEPPGPDGRRATSPSRTSPFSLLRLLFLVDYLADQTKGLPIKTALDDNLSLANKKSILERVAQLSNGHTTLRAREWGSLPWRSSLLLRFLGLLHAGNPVTCYFLYTARHNGEYRNVGRNLIMNVWGRTRGSTRAGYIFKNVAVWYSLVRFYPNFYLVLTGFISILIQF